MNVTTAIFVSSALIGCAGSSGSVIQRHDGTTREYIASSDDAWVIAKDYLRKISNEGHIVEDKSANFMSVRVSRVDVPNGLALKKEAVDYLEHRRPPRLPE